MEQVYYLDYAFVINFGMDYLLLWLAGAYLKRRCGIRRRLLGAAFGGLLACIAGIGGMSLWLRLGMMLTGALLICRMVFRTAKWRLLADTTAFFGTTFVLGGILGSLEVAEGGWLLLFTLLIAGLLRLVIYCQKENKQRRIYPVRLELFGKSVSCQGLFDTGNSLYEPFRKKPVIVCESSLLIEIVEQGLSEHPEKTCMIPFSSVGKKEGMLKGTELSELVIFCEEGEIRQSGVVVALADEVTTSGKYQVILHPDLL